MEKKISAVWIAVIGVLVSVMVVLTVWGILAGRPAAAVAGFAAMSALIFVKHMEWPAVGVTRGRQAP